MLVVFTGGTGGAKLIEGFRFTVNSKDLIIICNTADDFILHGLHISPDLDTVTYTLAGIADPEKGWGINDDSFVVLEALGRLGAETWFKLGDKDLATHITRTRLLREGRPLSQVTKHICAALGVEAAVVPMCDQRVATLVTTPQGDFSFQEYFVKRRWEDEVKGIFFDGIEDAEPAPGILDSISKAAAVVICPSNPVTSIGPILGVPGVRDALRQTQAPVIAVSPIIQGASFSGPAHRLMPAVKMEASAFGVAAAYADFLDAILIAREDQSLKSKIQALGIDAVAGPIRLDSLAHKKKLAESVLSLC
jgi:LPPG:FO 2-phospho-L-lactate transferase